MKEALIKILGEERLKKLMEFSEKLGKTPEDILRDHMDMKLFGAEEINF